MNKRFIKEEIIYTGEQLVSHWIYNNYGLKGDSIICFQGSAYVDIDDLVDLEDVNQKAIIYSQKMLHFIIEHFDTDLKKAILLQRLLIAIIGEEINSLVSGKMIKRLGDDLYDEEDKLSVSIATVSPVSGLIHAGINISSKETPIKTKGLDDYQIDVLAFGETVMERYCKEIEDMQIARCKVRAVR